MPAVARREGVLGNPVVSFVCQAAKPMPLLCCDGGRIVARWRDGENIYFTIKIEDAGRCMIRPIGDAPSLPTVRRTGTYNVRDLRLVGANIKLELEMYGRQLVPIGGCGPLVDVAVAEAGTTVHAVTYDSERREVLLDLSVGDIQGQTITVQGTRCSGG